MNPKFALSFAALAATLSLANAQSEPAMVPDSASAVVPLKVGASAPNPTLKDIEGEELDLSSILQGKPTVVVFYRGSWCPFCNKHLAELGQIEERIQKKGYQIIAISPDLPAGLKQMSEKNKLSYKLFSDASAEAMKAFGVGFRLDDKTYTMYKDNYNMDLEEKSGEKHHILPAPSVFVIDAKGTVKFVYSNADFKVRLNGTDLMKALAAK